MLIKSASALATARLTRTVPLDHTVRMHLGIVACILAVFWKVQPSLAIRYHEDGSISSHSGPVSFFDLLPSPNFSDSQSRSKRQRRLATAYGWTPGDVQLIVDEHNRLRRLVSALFFLSPQNSTADPFRCRRPTCS